MNKASTFFLAGLAFTASLSAQANDGSGYLGSLTENNAAGVETSYGVSQYRTQYNVSELLSAVAEDITQELTAFLAERLETEENVKDAQRAPEIASAYY